MLFQDALADEPALDLKENSEKFPILEESTEVILAKLNEVDPVMASRWHPNERRKIQRSLEIYLRTGKPASKLYDEQRLKRESSPSATDGGVDSLTSGLRFPTIVFWVHANKPVLYPRLDGRVEKMLQRGLLSEVQELASFRQDHESQTGTSIDSSRGIWVSIGYKEFLEYQDALNGQQKAEAELEQLKKVAIEKTQAASRQYANRQIKWIRIKLLNALIRADRKQNAFLVDASDLSNWQDDVALPAISITEQFLSGQPLPEPSSLSETAAEMLTPSREYDLAQRPDLWQKKLCDTCGTIAVTENDWSLHVKSRAHRKAVGMEKKLARGKNAPSKQRSTVQVEVVDVLEDYLESFPGELTPKKDD